MSTDRPDWFKSSHSHQNGECVEARRIGIGVELRDTKDRGTGTLAFGPDAWTAFLADVKRRDFPAA
ncbi:DUF397 domain-containing protein [Streptomyces sp. NPDC057654]|uniref:DUF397 domain-containing protein n=1 Tax=Streptomyces sp. NPDC057654 TaxID=3346196 RepID=UPI0036AEECF4